MNKTFARLSVRIVLAAAALSAWRVEAPAAPASAPALELVYSYPVETELKEPDLRLAQDVWPKMFDAAKTSIDLEHFYIAPSTGQPLEASLAALRRAAKRGVKIRFLLEKKFERNSLDGIAILKTIPGLELRIMDWSKLSGDGIIHAKFMIVDGKSAFVGSQNFDWRALKHIHETGLKIDEPALAAKVQAVFEQDWAAAGALEKGETPGPLRAERPALDRSATAYLVASPWAFNPDGVGDSEQELPRLIGEAKERLQIQLLDYSPLTRSKPPRFYPVIDNALRDAAARGVKVELLVSHWNTELPAVAHIKSLAMLPNVAVKVCTIPESADGRIPFSRVIHSKYMVIDGKRLWLGTSNWAGGYLDNSRNLELVVSDPALAERAARLHARVWGSPYSEAIDPLKDYPHPRR